MREGNARSPNMPERSATLELSLENIKNNAGGTACILAEALLKYFEELEKVKKFIKYK